MSNETIMRRNGVVDLKLSEVPGGGYAFRDILQLAAAELDARLVDKTAGTAAQNLFSSRNDGASTYVRSSTHFAADLDLTCISVWNSGSDARETAVAISPRHVLLAQHFWDDLGQGDSRTFRWVAADGTVVTRTLSNSAQIGSTDIRIGILDSDLPASIGFAKVLASDTPVLALIGAPVIYNDQNQQLFVGVITSDEVGVGLPGTSPRSTFYKLPVTGDSSHPVFVILDGQVVLLGEFFSATVAKNVASVYASVNSAMTSLGGTAQLSLFAISALRLNAMTQVGSDNGANLAGTIDLSAGAGTGATGGSISLKGSAGSGAAGGNIEMNGATYRAGAVRTSGGASVRGGDIDTSSGGDIKTAAGGGNIDTKLGFIQLGESGARTTIQNNATALRAQDLPDKDGTFAMLDDVPVFTVLALASDYAEDGTATHELGNVTLPQGYLFVSFAFGIADFNGATSVKFTLVGDDSALDPQVAPVVVDKRDHSYFQTSALVDGTGIILPTADANSIAGAGLVLFNNDAQVVRLKIRATGGTGTVKAGSAVIFQKIANA